MKIKETFYYVATVLLDKPVNVGDRIHSDQDTTIGIATDFLGQDLDGEGRHCLTYQILSFPTFEMRKRFVLHTFFEAFNRSESARVFRWLTYERARDIAYSYANGVRDDSPYTFAFCNVRDSDDRAIESIFNELMKDYGAFLYSHTAGACYPSFLAHELRNGPLDIPERKIDPREYGIYKQLHTEEAAQ